MITDRETSSQLILEFIGRSQLKNARSHFEQYQKKYPADCEGFFLEALLFHAEDREQEAYKAISRALSQDPENIRYRSLLAEILTALKKFCDAEKEYLKILHQEPDNFEFLTSYSTLLLLAGQIAKAQEISAWVLKNDPSHSSALLNLTLCQFLDGRLDLKSPELKSLLSQHPDWIATLVTFSQALSDQGRYTEALRLSQQMLRMNPSNTSFRDRVIDLKVMTHPLMVPYRFQALLGPAAPAIIWVCAVGALYLAFWMGSVPLMASIGIIYLVLAIGSWTIAPVLRKRYLKKGLAGCCL